ncbi:ABC transporter ATP-binding protein [Sporomusa sp.]|uniref:ABC transporter ATP-binding protein n=1 Tax=Sporomusa sp. TaxID=2078658 RepID=UPI002D7FD59B|nr:ABC transporter ATP-binding protein [Sporomusa sp.]
MWFFLRMFSLLKGGYRHVAGKTFLGIVITAIYVAQAFAVAKGLNSIFLNKSLQGLGAILLFISLLVAIRGLLHWLDEIYAKRIAFLVKSKLRERLFEHILHLGPAYQQSYRSGGLQAVLTEGVESLEPFLTSYIPQLLIALFGSGLIAVYIWHLDWLVGVVALSGVLIAAFFPMLMSPFVGKILLDYWRSYARLNAQYIDAMQGLPTLKVFNASQRKALDLDEEGWRHYRHSMQGLGTALFDSAMVKWAGAAGTTLATGVGAWRVASGILPLADLFVILFLTIECFRPLNDLVMFWHRSFLGLAAGREIFAVLDSAVTVKNPLTAVTKTLSAQPSIEFKNITFSYETGKRPALKDVSFRINPGETVAVVGKSGSGKSTLVNLLLRFFDPQQGSVVLDGRNVREYSLAELRSQIAVVFQDTYLFYGTVADNLRIAKPDATEEELARASQLAQSHGFITELPAGYQTQIGERGIRLSGGQKQRLSLARAILKDAPVLVLDEATSNVDGVSEELIQQALEGLTSQRTTLIIAHRLSTIQGADRIVVLDDCEVREAGTHQQLLSAGDIYVQLVRAQHA